MNLNDEIQAALNSRPAHPKGIRLSVSAFQELERGGFITRGSGGPLGLVEWATNVPWYSKDIFAWCDPSFQGQFELPVG
jgi:hypothetical protein